MGNTEIVRPEVLKYKEIFKPFMAITLILLSLTVALSSLLNKTRPVLFYYSFFGSLFSFLCFLLCYLISPHRNTIVFKIDEKGVFYTDVSYSDKESHFFEWSDLKQITVQRCYNKKGTKEKGLCFTTQENDVYVFFVFKYYAFNWRAIHRLKKTVPYFSKGRVPFKYYPIWDKSNLIP